MIDDPYFYRPPFWDIQEQLDRINRALSPAYLGVVDSFDAVARLQSTLDSLWWNFKSIYCIEHGLADVSNMARYVESAHHLKHCRKDSWR